MLSTEFWDNVFSKGQADSYSRVEMPDLGDPVLLRALEHFGNVEGKTIIDLGCGRGATSLFFASHGANVMSIDFSGIAIENLSRYCYDNGIGNVTPIKMPAQEISRLTRADFIFGSMILHHIEPLHEFVKDLRRVIGPDGKGFFWENNARSSAMIWFRQNIVGRLWIPKHGDPEEFPLTPGEVDLIREHFAVEIEYPELLYFRMISSYLFRNRFKHVSKRLDDYFFKYPAVRRLSYRQYLRLG